MRTSLRTPNLFWLGQALTAITLAGIAPKALPAQTRVACLGDSITLGARIEDKAHSSYPGWLQGYLGERFEVRNFGAGGRTMLRAADSPYHQTEAFRTALAWRPNIAIIILGTNDTCQNKRRHNWAHADSLEQDAAKLIASLRQANRDMRILLCSPTPMFPDKAGLKPARRADLETRAKRLARCARAAREVARQAPDVEYLELRGALRAQDVSDGVHPTAFGAERLARRIGEALRHPLTPSSAPRERLQKVLANATSPAETVVFHGFTGASFRLPESAAQCRVFSPHGTAAGTPWILRARFFGHQPALDIALLERGFHLVYCDVSDLYGSPQAIERYSELHTILAAAGFHRRAVLEGMSRGGLVILQWALAHPERVAAIYGDNPVVDIRSWPGGNSGKRSEPDWQRCLKAYGLSQSEADDLQPVTKERLRPLVDAGIPLMLVLGMKDEVVPVAENGGLLAERYASAGGEVEVWRKPSDGHHPHGLHPVDPLLRAILRATGFSQEITTKASPSVEYRSGAGWHGDSWRTQVAKMRDLAKQHAATPIVFLGDSITQGLTGARGRLTAPGGDRAIDRAFADHGAVSLGLSGDRTEHVLYRIRHGALQELNPQVIVLQIGVNNLVTGKHTANEVLRGVEAILASLRQAEPQATILVCGPFPSGPPDSRTRRATDQIHAAYDLMRAEERPRVRGTRTGQVLFQDLRHLFVNQDGTCNQNMRGDRIHISALGQDAWMRAIKPVVEEHLR